jgi:predicted NUDIX family NTP pyrophosphohydrolase
MTVQAAGILLYRPGCDGRPRSASDIEVLIAHMGGPYWATKDDRAWSIPKGLLEEGEHPLEAALREFAEEIGSPAPARDFDLLGEFRASSGKNVTVFVAAGDLDVTEITSTTFELEWPPRSGHRQLFPEMDAAAWFDLPTARTKVVAGQVAVLDAAEERLVGAASGP